MLCSVLPFCDMLVCFVGGRPACHTNSGYPFALICYAVTIVAVLAFYGRNTRSTFAELARAEAAVDAGVTRPRAVLHLAHNLFVYIFAFTLTYGFAMHYENASGGSLTHWFIATVLAGVVVYALVSKKDPQADALFNLAAALLLTGFLLALIDGERLASPASITLLYSETVFCELMNLSLCAITSRNRPNVLSSISWGYAAYFTAIEVGPSSASWSPRSPPTRGRHPGAWWPWCSGALCCTPCSPSATLGSTRPSPRSNPSRKPGLTRQSKSATPTASTPAATNL